jgi:DUF4097 and DUF4098 domain-containing protein YvlB
MTEERAAIIKLMTEGKITTEEAQKRLQALSDSPNPNMSRDELRQRMQRLGVREIRRDPVVGRKAVVEASEDGLTAAVRKQKNEFESRGRMLVRNVAGDTKIEGWGKTIIAFGHGDEGLWKANEREGMIMAKVLSGNLSAKAPFKTDLNLSSVSGIIEVRGVNGKTDARTVTGAVHLSGMTGTFNVSTNSGNIRALDLDGKCHIISVSGDIELSFRTALNGLTETRTGSIQVMVPEKANMILELEIVADGKVHNEVSAPHETLQSKPQHVILGFGAKEGRLWVRCRKGEITVKSRPPEPPAPSSNPPAPEPRA